MIYKWIKTRQYTVYAGPSSTTNCSLREFIPSIYIPSSSVPPKVNRATVLSQRYGRHGSRSEQIKHQGYIPVDTLCPDLKLFLNLTLCCDKTPRCTGCDSEEKALSWGDTGTFHTCFSTRNCTRSHNVESFYHFLLLGFMAWGWKLTACSSENRQWRLHGVELALNFQLKSSYSWLCFSKMDYCYAVLSKKPLVNVSFFNNQDLIHNLRCIQNPLNERIITVTFMAVANSYRAKAQINL